MYRLLFALLIFVNLAAPTTAQNWNGNGADDGASVQRAAAPNNIAIQQMDQRVTTLEAQVRQLTGELEKANYLNAQLQQQFVRMSQDLEIRFSEINQQMAQQQAAASMAAPAAEPASEEGQDSAETPATAAPANAQALYDDGFAKLRAADYAGAEKAFKQFLASYSSNQLAGNANYWLGETYYVRGQFKEAAVAFADGYQKYPKNSKAPDNLLKLAMSLSSLGSKQDACLTLGELKTKYPNAAQTVRTRADAERKKLGCK